MKWRNELKSYRGLIFLPLDKAWLAIYPFPPMCISQIPRIYGEQKQSFCFLHLKKINFCNLKTVHYPKTHNNQVQETTSYLSGVSLPSSVLKRVVVDPSNPHHMLKATILPVPSVKCQRTWAWCHCANVINNTHQMPLVKGYKMCCGGV